MGEDSGALVFWILAPAFLAVGLYLIWYARRRRRMLEAFARKHGLTLRPEQEAALQEILDRCFSLRQDGLARSVSQLSSIVDGRGVWIFRAVELLDLNPHAQTYSPHANHIAALFEAPAAEQDGFFLLDASQQIHARLPGARPPHGRIMDVSKQAARTCDARHTLSVTAARGHALIYFEPLVTGGESVSDIDCLYCIAERMRSALAGD